MTRRLLLSVVYGLVCVFGPTGATRACSGDDAKLVGSELYFPLAYGDRPTRDQLGALGRKMFFDPGLSASGKQSCANCHNPAFAYGPPNALSVQPGGVAMDRSAFRAAPSLRYLHAPIAFTEHFIEPEVTGGHDDEGPTGGRTWDGRVNTGHEQALMPLLDQNEMANADAHEIADRLSKSAYAVEFREAVSADGENVFDNTDAVVGWMGVALEAFEQSPADFHPFTSKYDAYLRDEVRLTAREQRGLELFNDLKKGNCVTCHPGALRNPPDHPPIFSDFGYVALGVPRNASIPANRDPQFFDLGLCGPLRKDLGAKVQYCGRFRTPSLRNVALRQSFFHNGVFHSLREVVEFYATRETNPQKWYPRGLDGQIVKYNDLPEPYRRNVNLDPPFAPLPGNRPRLSARDIDDIVAFLGTLTDGYVMPKAARTTPTVMNANR
jgi:cytochrome c peroxidase